jgi:hypothetical protein
MNKTDESWITASAISTTAGYSGSTTSTGTTLNTNLNDYTGQSLSSLRISDNNTLTFSNLYNMRTKQVKAAVFTIERNDKNEVISSKFVKELWVEIKNGASLDLAVGKELKGDYDPETTVIKEIFTVTF